jgi:hypothetical protein
MKCNWVTEVKSSNPAVSVSVFAMSTSNDDNRDDDTAIIEGLRAFRVATDKKMKISNSIKEEFTPLLSRH